VTKVLTPQVTSSYCTILGPGRSDGLFAKHRVGVVFLINTEKGRDLFLIL